MVGLTADYFMMVKNLNRKWHKWKEIYPLKAKLATEILAIMAGTGPMKKIILE